MSNPSKQHVQKHEGVKTPGVFKDRDQRWCTGHMAELGGGETGVRWAVRTLRICYRAGSSGTFWGEPHDFVVGT